MHDMMGTLSLPGSELRAKELFDQHQRSIHVRTDRVFARLMPFQWVGCVVVALLLPMKGSAGAFGGSHANLWAALLLGGLVTGWPVFCATRWPGTQMTRQTIAVAQTLMSALLIQLSGGPIEAHFHIFCSLALLAFYRDRRVLVTATIVAALDHLLRGAYMPLSVFGTHTYNPYRWLEHTAWVLSEDVFLMTSIGQSLREGLVMAQKQASLEIVNASIGRKIAERTAELTNEVAERIHISAVLAEERRQFEETLNNIPLVVFEQYFDSREHSFFVNAYVAKMFGYTPEEWTATPHFWTTRIHPEDLHRTSVHAAPDLDAISNMPTEWRWIARDGRVVWGDTHVAPLRDKAGNVIGIRGITIDITPRKMAEAEMEQMHMQLLEASRHAGMAEVATNVLHNIGSVLSRLNTSRSIIAEQVRKSEVASVGQAAGLLERHAGALPEFVTTHPAGKRLPKFFADLAKWLTEEQHAILAELDVLGRNIAHIEEIIAVQQGYSKASGERESLAIPSLVEHALQINAVGLATHQIEVVREFGDTPPTCVEKHKVVQILVNLIGNARNALAASERVGKRMIIRTACHEDMISITVTDNGAGIEEKNLNRIFGFTNKGDGLGFSLHSSALAATEMGGALSVTSAGIGQGAAFCLQLPVIQASSHPVSQLREA